MSKLKLTLLASPCRTRPRRVEQVPLPQAGDVPRSGMPRRSFVGFMYAYAARSRYAGPSGHASAYALSAVRRRVIFNLEKECHEN